MKRKNIILVMLLAIAGIFTMPGCTKDESPTPVIFKAAVPANPTPANGGQVDYVQGNTYTLKWDGAATSTWDVYLADTLYKSGVTGNSVTFTATAPGEISWHVYTIDANKVFSVSPTWSFTLWEPITIFLGNYTADEPAETYTYPVVFTRGNATTLDIDAYWNSWPAQFVLNFTDNTYAMAKTNFDAHWSGIESGTIDPKTGTIVGTYTIWKDGVVNETGTHTYTKD